METIFKHKWQADCNCSCWEKHKAQGIRKQIYSLSEIYIYTHTPNVLKVTQEIMVNKQTGFQKCPIPSSLHSSFVFISFRTIPKADFPSLRCLKQSPFWKGKKHISACLCYPAHLPLACFICSTGSVSRGNPCSKPSSTACPSSCPRVCWQSHYSITNARGKALLLWSCETIGLRANIKRSMP